MASWKMIYGEMIFEKYRHTVTACANLLKVSALRRDSCGGFTVTLLSQIWLIGAFVWGGV